VGRKDETGVRYPGGLETSSTSAVKPILDRSCVALPYGQGRASRPANPYRETTRTVNLTECDDVPGTTTGLGWDSAAASGTSPSSACGPGQKRHGNPLFQSRRSLIVGRVRARLDGLVEPGRIPIEDASRAPALN